MSDAVAVSDVQRDGKRVFLAKADGWAPPSAGQVAEAFLIYLQAPECDYLRPSPHEEAEITAASLEQELFPEFLLVFGIPRMSWRGVAIELGKLIPKRRGCSYRAKRKGGKVRRVGHIFYCVPPAGEPA